MEHIEHPSRAVWEERRQWFESLNEELAGEGVYLMSEQACALVAEVQAVFCSRAWIAVLILAMAAVDAQLRETEVTGFKGDTKSLIETAGADSRLQELRRRRNSLIHVNPGNPALTVDDQWSNRERLESEARSVVRLMFEAFYIGPWV